ncbi:MAG: primosomal protein N' [Sphaerochaetaceae bacterium]|nr:primosomal protein N' [Sphaerochaetaceae bacterium]
MTRYLRVLIPVPLKTDFLYSFDSEKYTVQSGMRVEVMFGRLKKKGYVIEVLDQKPECDFEIKEIIRVIDKEPLFSDEHRALSLWMEKFYFSSRGEVMDTMIPGGKRDVSYGGLDSHMAQQRQAVELSDQQKNAVETITGSSSSMFYLYGITGSGKTEVFLNCVERVLSSGGQVIYLVPEITLTHQLARQVSMRFKDNVAILHSGLTDAQRITQWRKIRRGEVGFVIGARSAVFAPCEKLKMIIIDEEHENSYKSGNDPRYHARQVAQWRISRCGGKLVMGSATPSLEAWHLMNQGKMMRLDLNKRLGGGKLPQVKIVDMSSENGLFSQELQRQMNRTLSEGKQVILFLNRRGHSYYYHCSNCGFELKCPHCDVAMTYHRSAGELVCHYCGHRQKPVSVCPQCGSVNVLYSGVGTEFVETEIKRLFPFYRCARLDTDTVSKDRKTIDKTLGEFAKGEVQILLGTQMVAKGLDFPGVSLVGIILADSGLLMPDFRANERTFDLLVQVSGRSGRSDDSGMVIIQTRMPCNDTIKLASRARVEEFASTELKVREQLKFPPFTRMINTVFRSKDRMRAFKAAEEVASRLRKAGGNFEVVSAQECPIEKVREQYRFQVVMKSTDVMSMINALSAALKDFKPAQVRIEVDVDPLELL